MTARRLTVGGHVGIVVAPYEVPVLKEVAMAADRASAMPEVKALAWEIFQALDKLPADVRDISNEL